MSTPSQDDELLSILLINLRNATATFGEGTPPVESIRTTLADHVQAMKAKGLGTNLNAARGQSVSGYGIAMEGVEMQGAEGVGKGEGTEGVRAAFEGLGLGEGEKR